MRRLLCAGIYWLIEPMLDLLDERKAKLATQQAERAELAAGKLGIGIEGGFTTFGKTP